LRIREAAGVCESGCDPDPFLWAARRIDAKVDVISVIDAIYTGG
jgi:hypothetical protein